MFTKQELNNRLRTLFAKTAVATLLSLSAIAVAPQNATAADGSDGMVINRALLFDRNQEGSKFYRIPAIVTLDDGTLVAVADRRIDSNKDLPGRIDVVCRRSTDRGATWTPQTTVAANDSTGGYGDPALVVDRKSGDIICIMTHGQGLWEADPEKPDDYARITISRSSDAGQTWSKPTDITDQFFGRPGSGKPIEGITGFATSGRALQLRDGRLMFALVTRCNAKKWSPLDVFTVYSDDGGQTWTSSGVSADNAGDETKLAELPDGRILMSIRAKGHRRFCFSADRGLTWTAPQPVDELVEPACNGDLISFQRNGKDLLMQTIPNDPTQRRNITIFISHDNGATWPESYAVCPFPSAYSSVTILDDGTIGILTEESANDGGLRIWFTRLAYFAD